VPKGYYKDITQELKRLGYIYQRNAKGSHEWWFNAETQTKILVAPNSKSRDLANKILKDAGSTKKF